MDRGGNVLMVIYSNTYKDSESDVVVGNLTSDLWNAHKDDICRQEHCTGKQIPTNHMTLVVIL